MSNYSKTLNKQAGKLKICFVFKGDIFYSSAPTNRVLSLAEGLNILGAESFIYGFVPLKDKKFASNGKLYNIPYSYPNIKSRSFFIRAIISIIDLFVRLPKFIVQNKVNIIYIYSIPLISKWIILLQRIIFSYKVVEEANEYPLILLKNCRMKKYYGRLLILFSYKFLDGMIVMTNNLLNYYKQLTSQKTRFEIINMTVDISRFINMRQMIIPEFNYLAYCGGLSQRKDGIITLIEAFSQVLIIHSELKLIIIGEGTKLENELIFNTIKKFGIIDKVILTGYLPKEDIPEFLSNSIGLILPRPNSFQAEGGFPTKLGEYLASGKPVIATRVGEIPKFLIDGENAFIAEPESKESLVAKMVELLSDPIRSRVIGFKGQQLIKKEFNHIVQSKKLYGFLTSL